MKKIASAPTLLWLCGGLLLVAGCGDPGAGSGEFVEWTPEPSTNASVNPDETAAHPDSDIETSLSEVPPDLSLSPSNIPEVVPDSNPSEQPNVGATSIGATSEQAGDAPGAIKVVENASDSASLSASAAGSSASQSDGGVQPASLNLPSDVERKPKLLVPTRVFDSVGPQGAARVSFDDIDLLKVLNMEPVTPAAIELMPGWMKGLNGKRVRIRGFMYPTFQETDIPFFILARDNQICCFGRNPKIYDLVEVTMRESVTTDYIPNRPFDVVGIFHIEHAVEDGKLQRLYQINDATIIDR